MLSKAVKAAMMQLTVQNVNRDNITHKMVNVSIVKPLTSAVYAVEKILAINVIKTTFRTKASANSATVSSPNAYCVAVRKNALNASRATSSTIKAIAPAAIRSYQPV